MTRRERLRRCYFNETLDRPAVYSRTGFPGGDPSYDRLKAYLREYSELKAWWSTSFVQAPYAVEQCTQPHSVDFRRHVAVLHTPKGDLRKSWLEGLRGQPGLSETYYIKDRADAEKYLSLPMPEIGGDVSSFFARDAEMGDRGIVDAGINSNPAGHVVGLCGSETFALMSLTDRDVLHALCERQQRIIMPMVKFLLAQKAGPFFGLEGQEYLTPPMHGPRDFDDFNVRYDKPIIDLIHDGGGRVHVHCHGSIKLVFGGFLAMGADVLHPFEGPPMTDLLPSQAKRLARGRLCLEGNIQINRMYDCPPEEIARETRDLIRDAFADRNGLIVSPTASPYIFGRGEDCFPQYKAMVDAVTAWRG